MPCLCRAATHAAWVQNGRRSAGGLPSGFGNAQLSLYGNVEVASESLKPLCTNVTTAELLRARKAIHNHLWGGGGASYTDVYRIIVELVLCRHHDECTTRKGAAYAFQQRQGESAAVLAERMTKLCRDAAKAVISPFASESRCGLVVGLNFMSKLTPLEQSNRTGQKQQILTYHHSTKTGGFTNTVTEWQRHRRFRNFARLIVSRGSGAAKRSTSRLDTTTISCFTIHLGTMCCIAGRVSAVM